MNVVEKVSVPLSECERIFNDFNSKATRTISVLGMNGKVVIDGDSIIKLTNADSNELEAMLHMATMFPSHVPKLEKVWVCGSNVLMFQMSRIEGKTLDRFLSNAKESDLPDIRKRGSIFVKMLSKFLIDVPGFSHGDFHGENVMVPTDTEQNWTMIDFGMARQVIDKNDVKKRAHDLAFLCAHLKCYGIKYKSSSIKRWTENVFIPSIAAINGTVMMRKCFDRAYKEFCAKFRALKPSETTLMSSLDHKNLSLPVIVLGSFISVAVNDIGARLFKRLS